MQDQLKAIREHVIEELKSVQDSNALEQLRVRGLGMGIAGLTLWAANWVVAQFFLPLVEWLTGPIAFAILGVLGIVAMGYTRALVPETMGRSLEEVGRTLRRRYSED